MTAGHHNSNDRRTRFTIDLSPTLHALVLEMTDRLDTSSAADTMRTALRLLALIEREVRSGSSIVIESPQGERRHIELVMLVD